MSVKIEDQSPSYSTQPTPSDPAPEYPWPESFDIGGNYTGRALVDTLRVKGHLRLLYAFTALRSQVEESADELPLIENKEQRWSWFVHLAVERFDRWCQGMSGIKHGPVTLDHMPPLDVVMVWHAYLLNPSRYTEDILRVPTLTGLYRASDQFVRWLTDCIGLVTSTTASPSREKLWISMTSTPFDPFEAAEQLTHKAVICPYCDTIIRRVPFLNDRGTGYAQLHFTVTCPNISCSRKSTKETLAIARFASDAVRNDGSNYSFFAGSLHAPNNARDKAQAKAIKYAFMSLSALQRPTSSNGYKPHDLEWERHILTIVDTLPKLQQLVGEKMNRKPGGGRTLERIMSAYADERMFSVELVGAVLRQGSFVAKMQEIGWTEPSFFDSLDSEPVLCHSIARYHGFLDLIASSPSSFFVPTLDIDLVWHTHQLTPRSYGWDCMRYIGRYVDHDDKVEENKLSASFDSTSRAWENRFGVQYTHCGCPQPGNTVGSKLRRLFHSVRDHPLRFMPTEHDDLLAATHPSDHNAVYTPESRKLSDARRAEIAKRQQREAALAQKGELSPKAIKRAQMHDCSAFMAPVPIYYFGSGAGGCASTGGDTADCKSAGGCAASNISGCVNSGGAAYISAIVCAGGGGGSGGGCGGGSGGGGGCGGGGAGCGGGGC